MSQSSLLGDCDGCGRRDGGAEDPEEKVLKAIIDRVQKQVKERRLLLSSFFRAFDSLKLLRVTREQFIRALTTAGIRLHPAEFSYLAKAFPVPGQPSYLVHYGTFCDKVSWIP